MKLLLTSGGVINPSIHRRSYSSSADGRRMPRAGRPDRTVGRHPLDGSVQVISEGRWKKDKIEVS
jgi:hypothetical protein